MRWLPIVLILGCAPDVSLRVTSPRSTWGATALVPARAVVEVRENGELFDGEVQIFTGLGGFGSARTDTATVQVRRGSGDVDLFTEEPGPARILAELGIFTDTTTISFVDPSWSVTVRAQDTAGSTVEVEIGVDSPVVERRRGLPVTVGTDLGWFVTPDGGRDTQSRTVELSSTGSVAVTLRSETRGTARLSVEFDGLETLHDVAFE